MDEQDTLNIEDVGSRPMTATHTEVLQWLEISSDKRKVGGSTPSLGTMTAEPEGKAVVCKTIQLGSIPRAVS